MSVDNKARALISPDAFGSYPGITFRAGDFTKLELYLGPKAESSLKTGTARLVLAARKEVEKVRISIGAFERRISISLMSGTCAVDLGDCGAMSLDMTLYDQSSVIIGDRTTCNSANLVAASSKIVIGEDCMLSHNIVLQSCDQHGIIDLKSMEIVNKKRDIIIDDHVWLGKGCFICPGSMVGLGSIVAAMSVVTKSVAPFTLVAGSPATIVRSDVSWSRQLEEIDDRSMALFRKRAPRYPK